MGVFDAIKRAVGLGKQEKPVSWPASVPEPEPEPIQVAELTPAELVAQQAAGKPFVLVDVRSSGEQFIGHLVGPLPSRRAGHQ
ncbi:hypothetical protein [Candidatus Amarolinea dominans]|uniref:hypothetical protein n=1 Tax=Candidatus Amarolinea dominans TaxID=3140696 RepID=UPI0031CC442A